MVSRALDVVRVVKHALFTPVRNFSGGNQQKIAVAKWLLAKAHVCCCTIRREDRCRHQDRNLPFIRRYTEAGGAVLLLLHRDS